MGKRIYYLVWEQLHQMSWLLFAVANALFAFAVAEVTAYFSYYISRGDAAELSDLYAMASLLFVIIGAHFSVERGRVLELIVPIRVMRLPMGSYALAAGWVLVRALCVAAVLLGILAVRQFFTEGKTELPLIASFIYYYSIYLWLLGLVRVAAVWRDQAIPWALTAGVVLFALYSQEHWIDVRHAPGWTLLKALVCLPVAVGAIVLRRRGGVYLGGLDLLPASMQQRYQRVADIPAFEDRLAAQSWFEWRWHGLVLPGLTLFGCSTLLGSTLLFGVEWYAGDIRSFVELFWYLLGCLCLAAVLTALYLLASDTFRVRRAQSRFLYVQPIGGVLFAQARQRLLLRSAGWGLFVAATSAIVLIAAVGLSDGGVAGVSDSSYLQGARGTTFAQEIVRRAYAIDELQQSEYQEEYVATSLSALGTGGSRFAGLVSVALTVGALLFLGNRFALLGLGSMLVCFVLYEPAEWGAYGKIPVATVCTAFAIFLMLSTALGSALHARVVRPWQAFHCVVVYLVGGMLLRVLGPGNWLEQILFVMLVSLFPLGFPLAVIVIARPAMAVAYQARRAGSIMAPQVARTGGRDPQWAQVGLTAAAVSLLLLGAGLAWRTVPPQALAGELAASREFGVAPESPRPAPVRPGGLTTGHAGLLSAKLSRLNLDYNLLTRHLKINEPGLELEATLAPLFESAQLGLPGEFMQGMTELLPDLERLLGAIGQLPNASAQELALAAEGFQRSLDSYSEQDQVAMSAVNMSGVVLLALEQCFVYAIVAAERRDVDACTRAIRAQVRLLDMHGGCRAYPCIVQRDRLVNRVLETVEYVLQRVALPVETCTALLALLPPEFEEEDLRYALHNEAVLSGEYMSGGYYRRFGNTRWPVSAGSYLQGYVEDALLMNTLADALKVNTANQAILNFRRHRTGLEAVSADYYSPSNSPLEFWPVVVVRALPLQLAVGDSALNLLRTVLALEAYRAQQGEYPEKLDALMPGIIASVPTDWTRVSQSSPNAPVRYLRTSPGSFRAYASGEDCVDNLGARQVSIRYDIQGWRYAGDIVVRVMRP